MLHTTETVISYQSRKQLLTAWRIRSNAEVHGIYYAAIKAKKEGINIDIVLKSLGFSYVKRLNSI